jgi:hypothetical protein
MGTSIKDIVRIEISEKNRFFTAKGFFYKWVYRGVLMFMRTMRFIRGGFGVNP